jgi:hypothetical protein
MEYKEQLFLWKQVQTQNIILIKIPGSRTAFEFGPNLLGDQIGLKKSGKFPKNLIFLALSDCEFRLVWLYDKIWSPPTSSPWTWFERNWKEGFNLDSTKPSSHALDFQQLQDETL